MVTAGSGPALRLGHPAFLQAAEPAVPVAGHQIVDRIAERPGNDPQQRRPFARPRPVRSESRARRRSGPGTARPSSRMTVWEACGSSVAGTRSRAVLP